MVDVGDDGDVANIVSAIVRGAQLSHGFSCPLPKKKTPGLSGVEQVVYPKRPEADKSVSCLCFDMRHGIVMSDLPDRPHDIDRSASSALRYSSSAAAPASV